MSDPGIGRALRHSMWALAWCALAFIATVGFCACGGASGSTEASSLRDFGSAATGAQTHQAETALRAYFVALASSEWSKACSYLSKQARRANASRARARHEGDSCVAGLGAATERLSSSHPALLAVPDVYSVRSEGARGYVLYGQTGRGESTMPIRSEGGKWRLLAVLAPVGLPVSPE